MSIKINSTGRYVLIFFLLLPWFAQAQEANRKIRIFLIGNSFSQNASTYLEELAKEAGVELIVGRAELGGCSLERHWGIMEAYENDSDDPKGKSYKGKSFQERFAEEQWDFVTIQQYSKHSTDPDTYRPYAQKIYNLIKRLQPQAEVLMHQTWAYRSDSKDWGRISATEDTKSEAEMYKKSREAYHTIANELGIRILPVGDAFWVAGQHRKFKFQGDDKFTYETPPAGQVPDERYSLHTGYFWRGEEVKEFRFDSHHANDAGKFLGSLVWYGVMFEASPAKVQFVPEGMDPDFAKHLKKTAAKVVKANGKRSVAVAQ